MALPMTSLDARRKSTIASALVIVCASALVIGISVRNDSRSLVEDGYRSVGEAPTGAVLPYVKPPEMIQRSDVIVVGTVASATATVANEAGTAVYTDFNVAVEQTLKGGPPSEIVVRSPGGWVPGTGRVVQMEPLIGVGEHVLLFLTTETLPVWDMVDGEQYYISFWDAGKYVITSQGLALNQQWKEFNEPLTQMVERVEALEAGFPDPHPLPGLPTFETGSD